MWHAHANLVAFSCNWIFYGGLDAWPITTEIPGMTLLFLEYGMSQSMAFRCKTLTSSHLRPGNTFDLIGELN
jgi:hypothetical protein